MYNPLMVGILDRVGAATLLLLTAHTSLAEGLDPLSCLIEASEVVELATPVAGIVREVRAHRGDVVGAGEVIAALDTTVEEIDLRLAEKRAANQTTIRAREARVLFLEAQANRATALSESNAVAKSATEEAVQEAEVARQELQAARFDLEVARVEAERARALLERKILRSPVDGVVVERLLSVGDYQAGETHVATIAAIKELRVQAFAPMEYYRQVAVGDTVTVRPENPIGGNYEAKVSVIDKVFDASTGTFGLEIDLPNPDSALPAGLRCSVAFGASGFEEETSGNNQN